MQKHESEMKCLKEQYQKNIEEQGKQIEKRLKAEVDLYKEDMDAMAEQNRELKDKMEQMGRDMQEKNHEIRRIKVLFFSLCWFDLFSFVLFWFYYNLFSFSSFWRFLMSCCLLCLLHGFCT